MTLTMPSVYNVSNRFNSLCSHGIIMSEQPIKCAFNVHEHHGDKVGGWVGNS